MGSFDIVVDLLSIIFFSISILIIIGMVLYVIFAPDPLRRKEVDVLKTEYDSKEGEPKPFFEMSRSELIEFRKESDRIENDNSMEKKYIRFCLDELTQYPSGYRLTLKESEPFPDYSEKGMDQIPTFKDLYAKIKWLVKLEDCAYIDPKVCKLPFHVSNLEGGCDSFSEICDGSDELYISFWLKKYNV